MNGFATDEDSQQYGRQIAERIFEFKERIYTSFNEFETVQLIIKLDDHETKEIEHIINSYGYTLLSRENKAAGYENINELYGEQANWIIAECIFETESSPY
jgi:hypothetical protein